MRPGRADALEGFRASITRYGLAGLAPEARLSSLELTPLAFLDAIGVEPALVRPVPPPREPSSSKSKENLTLTSLLAKMARDLYAKAPELQAVEPQASASKR